MTGIDRQSARFGYCHPPRRKLMPAPACTCAPLNQYGDPCGRCGKAGANKPTHIDSRMVWVCRRQCGQLADEFSEFNSGAQLEQEAA